MEKKLFLILLISCISSQSLTITWPFGSSGKIDENDLTIKNPEKFEKNIYKKYFDAVDTFVNRVKKDIKLGNFGQAKNSALIEQYLAVITNINDRMVRLKGRLEYKTGKNFHEFIINKYFSNLANFIDKSTDPVNLLNRKYPNFLYRFLAWNIFDGKESADSIKQLPADKISHEILRLADSQPKEKNQYAMLLREIRSFFSDELGKQEYDAYIDGPQALDKLVISNDKDRDALLRRWDDIFINKIPEIKLELLTIQSRLKKV